MLLLPMDNFLLWHHKRTTSCILSFFHCSKKRIHLEMLGNWLNTLIQNFSMLSVCQVICMYTIRVLEAFI